MARSEQSHGAHTAFTAPSTSLPSSSSAAPGSSSIPSSRRPNHTHSNVRRASFLGSPNVGVGADPRSSAPSRASSLRSAPAAPLDRACEPWRKGRYDGEEALPVSVEEDGRIGEQGALRCQQGLPASWPPGTGPAGSRRARRARRPPPAPLLADREAGGYLGRASDAATDGEQRVMSRFSHPLQR